MFVNNKLRLTVLLLAFIALALSGCSTNPPVQQVSQDDFFGDEAFFTNVEYYFYFLGKSVPSHFKPVRPGSNIYMPDTATRLGQEFMQVGVRDGKIRMVWVYCIFNNRSDFDKWVISYIDEAKELGFQFGRDPESGVVYFAKENYDFAFAFEEKNRELFGGEFTFYFLK